MRRYSILACLILLTISACTPVHPQELLTVAAPSTQTPVPPATFTATPASTPTSTLTPVPDGPCDNPLLPLGSLDRWTYRVTARGVDSIFHLASLGVSQGTNITGMFEYTDEKRAITIRERVICQGGAIVNFPLLVMSMLLSEYLDTYIDTYHMSVDYFPNYATLAQQDWNLSWQTRYLTETRAFLSDPEGGTGLTIPANTYVNVVFAAAGERETLSTPAGTFPQALKLEELFSMPVTFIIPGSKSGTSFFLRISTTQWFEPYVGLVRARITSAVLFGKLELPIESTLELIEYQPGN